MRRIAEVEHILRRTRPPEILIIEMSMESMDLCRGLRAEPKDYYPYVLMTAANDDKTVGELALHSGADDLLPKPFDALGMLARLSVARRILDFQDRLIISREELRVQATKDFLTGLFNRAAFLDLFQRELDRAARTRSHRFLASLLGPIQED
jgi:PleD family two-component response regulator